MSNSNAEPFNWARMDVAAVRHQARVTWERKARAAVPISERIGASVPYWLILVLIGIVILSASHTITMLSGLSAWDGRVVGSAGVIAIEFGMLYAAFRKKQLELRGLKWHQMGSVIWFSRLVFFTALFINVSGSVLEAMKQTNISTLSAGDALQQFSVLPLATQAAIIVSIMIGIFIPTGLEIAGEGMAALFLEREASGDWLERQWARVKQTVEYEAIRDTAVRLGARPGDAARFAWGMVKDEHRPSASVLPKPDDAPDKPDKPDGRSDGQTDANPVKQPASTGSEQPRPLPARTISGGTADAKAWLRTHPEEVMGNPRPTWLAENVEAPKLSKQRWSEAIKAVREELQVVEAVAPEAVSSNGNGAHDATQK